MPAACRSCPIGLAYPELYPSRFRYRDPDELASMLRECVLRRPAPFQARALAERFTFEQLTPEYVRLLSEVAGYAAR